STHRRTSASAPGGPASRSCANALRVSPAAARRASLESPTMFAVLVLLSTPPATEPIERAIPFASLPPAQAAELAGKIRLYKVVLDSAPGEWAKRVGYDAAHDDEPAIRGSVYIDREAGEDETVVYVRAVLLVIRHPRRGSRGQFGGFTEDRLVGTGGGGGASAGGGGGARRRGRRPPRGPEQGCGGPRQAGPCSRGILDA